MTDPALDAQDTARVETQPTPAVQPALKISGEFILYAVVILMAVALRLPELGTFPLNATEAREALAVFRTIDPRAPGNPITPAQPLMFAANALFMTVGGSEPAAARLATTLLGAGIVLLPLLYRGWLGKTRALLFATLLASSPVLFVASRSMGGAVWSLALLLLGVWLAGQFAETARPRYAIGATVMAALLLFASEPAGFLMAAALLAGLIFAAITTDDSDGTLRGLFAEVRRAWPSAQAFPIAAFALIVVTTLFLIHPSGLSSIGEVIGRALAGFLRRPDGAPLAHPLVISLVYEPVLWLFGIAGAFFVIQDDVEDNSGRVRFIGRVLIGWLLLAVLLGLFYAGAGPDHALWFTLPLVGLSLFVVEKLCTPIRDAFWRAPLWGPLIHAIAAVAILSIITINLMSFGRSILTLNVVEIAPTITGQVLEVFALAVIVALIGAGYVLVSAVWGPRLAPVVLLIGGALALVVIIRAAIPLLTPALFQAMPTQLWLKLVFVLLSSALFVITYFLVGSTWGPGAAWRGLGLGLLLFLSAVGLSAGWRTGVTHADNPADLWHINPVGRNLNLIEATLEEASLRSVGMPHDMDIVVQLADGERDDTPLAWLVRRFHKATFTTELSTAVNAHAVIALNTDPQPSLGATYVGQKFPGAFTWRRDTILLFDVIAWLYDRQVRYPPTALREYILYLRGDVYGLENVPKIGG